jgi:alpha-beta hydrolase superfamily lysophospholipase
MLLEEFMQGQFYLDNGIFVRVWDDIKNQPKAVIQIIHGMGEHSQRYDHVAKYFNKIGYLVYADDHRGHGYSVDSKEKLGMIKENFTTLVEDEKYLTDFISKTHIDVPIYILGHSMGSFIAQGHMADNFLAKGYILSGSCGKRSVETYLGWLLSWLLKIIFNNKRSPFVKKLIFLGYNRKIKNKISSFDWLTRRKETVKEYTEDPLCDFTYCSGFYASFLKFLNDLYKRKTFKSTIRSIPIFLISGEEDPVGLYGKGVKKLFEFYMEESFENVRMKLYRGARHEILSEVNCIEVLEDIKKWIEN